MCLKNISLLKIAVGATLATSKVRDQWCMQEFLNMGMQGEKLRERVLRIVFVFQNNPRNCSLESYCLNFGY